MTQEAMPASDEVIAKIEAALEKATPRPWLQAYRKGQGLAQIWSENAPDMRKPPNALNAGHIASQWTEDGPDLGFDVDGQPQCADDAAAIVLLRNETPALLARLRTSEQQRDEAWYRLGTLGLDPDLSPDLVDLISRLGTMYDHRGDGAPTQIRNPDGPAAAAAIEGLAEKLRAETAAREAAEREQDALQNEHAASERMSAFQRRRAETAERQAIKPLRAAVEYMRSRRTDCSEPYPLARCEAILALLERNSDNAR